MIALLLTSLMALAYEPTVYSALASAPARVPLGGSFDAGEKLLRAADPVEEANAAYDAGHAGYLRVCGFACTAVGVESDAGADAESLTIPATSDTLSARNKGYNEAAFEFAKKYNVRMHERLVADSGGAAPASAPASAADGKSSPASPAGAPLKPGAEGKPATDAKASGAKTPTGAADAAVIAKPIAGSLSEKELSINGVTIGKSNLYNSTGKFGTNMFKKEGDIYVICWKGEDGTTMAFESDKGGGPDQTITRALLLSSSTEYAHAKDCRTSKKVSAPSLALAGIRLGQPVPQRASAPTETTEFGQTWKYESEKKGKKIAQDLEVKTTDAKVTSVSIWKH